MLIQNLYINQRFDNRNLQTYLNQENIAKSPDLLDLVILKNLAPIY